MRYSFFVLLFFPLFTFAQGTSPKGTSRHPVPVAEAKAPLVSEAHQLTLSAALDMLGRAQAKAASTQKVVSVAVVDASGEVLLLTRGDGVGPHNTEAARRKAYTALSTKTATLTLGRNAKTNPDTENLAHLPELLLLGGGIPLWHEGKVIGGLGIAGGGGPEQDDAIARAALLPEANTTTR
ncbi:heme-binding protein [Rufibacter glacialis]|uniref:Heme-binding protein n=1 Tax=Rufibacter glacialis TaxID=1259555 RepID=A0A5M8Q7P6_9BACT|nr:heme-binding protein [Rufibacter glacialis]KAA6431148.1 heme-binding protein [Rufibacter glacialis]GGK84468.1 hypothetical protein GCM10011405_35420 [Rufibacter glacialis]